MKYPCEMINDLLPLYYDNACSDETKKIVEEHLSECDSCKKILEKIGDNTYSERLQAERELVMGRYTKNVKKITSIAGLCVLLVPLLVCFVVNIATGSTLDWFFIVLTALMAFASLTVVPLIVEARKLLWTFGSFTISLILLLMTCCIYSGGDWFFVASIAVLFGLSFVFLPFIIGQIPLKGFALYNKGIVIMAVDTILLYLLIITCGFYGNPVGYWKTALLITTITVLFVWFLFAIIRYLKANGFVRAGICVIASGFFIAFFNDVYNWISEGVMHINLLDANLLLWNSDKLINANVYLLIIISTCVIGSILFVIGSIRKRMKRIRVSKGHVQN